MEGQGANVALPVYANFMKKVFADSKLGYSEKETFDVPDEYKNPCASRNKKENRNESRPSGFDEFFN
jgi:penicillin-binding protein 1A